MRKTEGERFLIGVSGDHEKHTESSWTPPPRNTHTYTFCPLTRAVNWVVGWCLWWWLEGVEEGRGGGLLSDALQLLWLTAGTGSEGVGLREEKSFSLYAAFLRLTFSSTSPNSSRPPLGFFFYFLPLLLSLSCFPLTFLLLCIPSSIYIHLHAESYDNNSSWGHLWLPVFFSLPPFSPCSLPQKQKD